MEPVIEATNVSKEFRISKRHKNVIKNLFSHEYRIVHAVHEISFSIRSGEMVGFIGPNGAGKSTTIKMLTGILVPTSGQVSVLGNDPFQKRKKNASNIGVVFGQRTQLWWDLPVCDTFELLKKIYNISDAVYKDNIELFRNKLNLDEYWDKAVRQLSLGQRMRADIAASLLHNPKVLLLDEPTIGLDVVVKKDIRELIKTIRNERGITVLLTTHDMRDIEEICERVLMIDKGKLTFDLPLTKLKETMGSRQTLIIHFEEKVTNLEMGFCSAVQTGENVWQLEFDHHMITAGQIMSEIMQKYRVSDISVRQPDMEEIIRNVYRKNNSIRP